MAFTEADVQTQLKSLIDPNTDRDFVAGKSIKKIQIVGNDAIVRHMFTAENVAEGKTNAIKIGILMIWQKQGGRWKLLARQAYKV